MGGFFVPRVGGGSSGYGSMGGNPAAATLQASSGGNTPAVSRPAPQPTPAPPPPKPVTYSQVDPALTALSQRYNTYLNSVPGTQSKQMTMAAQAARDAAEGGRTALTESAAFRGADAVPALAEYDAATQRAIQGGIASEEVGNMAAYGQDIAGGLGVTTAPTTAALAESNYGLEAAKLGMEESGQTFNENLASETTDFNQNLATNQNNFNQLMASFNASRMSPIYGAGGYGYGSGSMGPYGMGSVLY